MFEHSSGDWTLPEPSSITGEDVVQIHLQDEGHDTKLGISLSKDEANMI